MPLVIESIYNVLTTRISAIEGDIVADEVEISEVVEPLATGNVSPRNGQYVVGWGDSVRDPEFDVPGNPPGLGFKQTFLIDCNVRDEESDVPFGLLATRYVGALVDALAVDGNWHTFGGYAIDAAIGDWSQRESSGGMGGIVVPLIVTYRVSEYDMTVQR